MPCMMCGDADALHRGNQGMLGNTRILMDDLFQYLPDHLLPRRWQKGLGVIKGLHRLIAGASLLGVAGFVQRRRTDVQA